MIRVSWLSAVIVAVLVAFLLVVRAAISAPAFAQETGGVPASDLTVSMSKSQMATLTGETFSFTSEIRNHGSQATPPLIANLNFVATDDSTYIDPEDWSSNRTVSVDPIAAGSSATLSWSVKPVLAGDVAVYVVILPQPPALAGAGPLAASPAIALHVQEHRAINPGGVLPVVLAVPALMAAAFAGLRVVRKRF